MRTVTRRVGLALALSASASLLLVTETICAIERSLATGGTVELTQLRGESAGTL